MSSIPALLDSTVAVRLYSLSVLARNDGTRVAFAEEVEEEDKVGVGVNDAFSERTGDAKVVEVGVPAV